MSCNRLAASRCAAVVLASLSLHVTAAAAATTVTTSAAVTATSAAGPAAALAAATTVADPPQPACVEVKPRRQTHLTSNISGVVADEFVVEFDPEVAAIARAAGNDSSPMTGFAPVDELASSAGVTAFRPLHPGASRARDLLRGLPDMSGWFVVTIDLSRSTLAASMEAFTASPFVREAQEIGYHSVYGNPNDPTFPQQWFLSQSSDHDIDAPEAWLIENGSAQIIVADLDTGVRYFHKDLGGSNTSYTHPTLAAGNVWTNPGEVNGIAGVDDDGDGFVDDWVGWDFVSAPIATCYGGEDCAGADNDPRDFNGHGTHTAGLVAAMNNNGYGVASAGGGFGPGFNTPAGDGVRVMCLRVGHSANINGEEVGIIRMDYAASAFYYAANHGARVATCSWGSSNSGGIAAAVKYFTQSGGLVFKAAGNDGTSSADYMCTRSDVYSVAATDKFDRKALFSNFGTWVDISSPGEGIYSTYHDHTQPTADAVASLDGTSMATPIVASVAAVVWSRHPEWSRTQVWNTIKQTCDDISILNPAYPGQLGAGRVNLLKALGGGLPTEGPTYLMSISGTPTLPGVGVVAESDIVRYDPATGVWSSYFRGASVGLAGKTIGTFTRVSSGDLLVTLRPAGTLPGLQGGPSGASYTASDILRFTPSSLGAVTAGSWTFEFDGSDVGLTGSGEAIDALAVLSDGRFLISTSGTPGVPGLTGLADEDLIAFNPTSLGAATTGTWSLWFDGSDVGMDASGEDIDAAFVDSHGALIFSTLGNFSVAGASGDGRDLVKFTPTSLGANTAGTFSLFLSGAAAGLPTGSNVTGFAILP